MEREEVEHAIRAAAAVTNEKELIIIGSQTIHGLKQDLPSDLLESQELDCYAPQAPEKYALIDGALGEGSRFDETFGYYVDGVSPNTATLPRGWESRTVPFESANTGGAEARMLEVHDLAIAKYVAGRKKDLEFLQHLAEYGLIQARVVEERLGSTSILETHRHRIRQQAKKHFSKAERIRILGEKVRGRLGKGGNPRGAVQASGTIDVQVVTEHRTQSLGTVETGADMALVLMWAGRMKPTEVPEYKKTLELERLEQMQRARARIPG